MAGDEDRNLRRFTENRFEEVSLGGLLTIAASFIYGAAKSNIFLQFSQFFILIYKIK